MLFASACAPAATPAPRQDLSSNQSAAPAAQAPAQPAPAEAPQPPGGANAANQSATTGIKNPAGLAVSPYGANRLIIKNGEMTLLVADTQRAIDQVVNVAVTSDGYVVSSKSWTQDNFTYASITMGVPVDQFEAAQRQLRALAMQVLSDTASGQDVSDQYVDLQSQLTNLEATEARIRDFLDKATKVQDALDVNKQLTEVEGEIEKIKGQMQYLKDRSAYSTIAVQLNPQIPTPTPTATPTATPTPTPVAWYPDKTFNAAAGTLTDLLRSLGDLLIWVGVVIVPVAVPIVIVAVIVNRLRRKNVRVSSPKPEA
jgi:hypothetical protein